MDESRITGIGCLATIVLGPAAGPVWLINRFAPIGTSLHLAGRISIYAATGLGLFFPVLFVLALVWGLEGPGWAYSPPDLFGSFIQIMVTLVAAANVLYLERRLMQIEARDWWLGVVVGWPFVLSLLGVIVTAPWQVASSGWGGVLFFGGLALSFAMVSSVGPQVIAHLPAAIVGGPPSAPRPDARRAHDGLHSRGKRSPSHIAGVGSSSMKATRPSGVGNQSEVRPSWIGKSSASFTRFLFGCGVGIPILLVIVPLVLAGQGMASAWLIDIPIAAAVGIAAGAGLLYVVNERVGVLNGCLYQVTAFGRRRSWRMSELHEIVRVHLRVGGWTSELWDIEEGVVDADLVVSAEGRAVVSFTGWWDRNALTTVWAATRLPIREPWRRPATVQEVRARYPGAVPWLPLSGDAVTTSPSGAVRQGLVLVGGCLGAAVLVVIVLAVMASAGTCQASR